MTLQPRHLGLAVALHAVLFFFILVGVQCSQPVETPPVVQGVLISPNDLKALKPPTPPAPTPPKPEEQDQGPQQIVNNTDVVADQAKQKQEQAAAEQKKLEEQKAEEQRQKEAQAKAEEERKQAEELKRQQEAQKAAEQAAAQKKQQEEEAKRKAAAAEAQRKKELEDQLKKEAEQQQQQAQAAAIARQKKAEEAQREADRRKRAAELQQQLGVESAQLTAQVQNEWITQLSAAIQQAWAWPPGTDPKTKAWLKIRLSATGQVLSADISTSSGVPLFDQTLKQAAYKASPLPLPRDPSAFDPNLTICFSPNQQSCTQ
ncbi:MAG TPA: cell envelope integrity protein TolA [Nevskia sp.]|nr:cell envelope integrity protein TolA [Nevskia sp.]